MSPAKTSTGTPAASRAASQKAPPARRSAAKRTPAKRTPAGPASAGPGPVPGRTDAELRDALVGLTSGDAMSWPHTTGLGQMMMWVGAYTRGLLPTGGHGDPGPSGLITN